LTSLLFLVVVVQVALAGFGAFDAVNKAEDAGSVTKKAIEDGWSAHAVVGIAVAVVILLLLLVALFGGLGNPWLQWAGGLFVLTILQFLFSTLGRSVPALGFLHAVNALAIYAGAALLAHRAWTRRNAPAA
jgi:Na+/citrate or Na+/malate symporter